MKRLTKKIFYLFMVCMLTMNFCLSTVMAAEPEEGWKFSSEDLYRAAKAYEKEILTYEATVYLPKDFNGRGGVILGNFFDDRTKSFSFEINTYGRPRLYLINSNRSPIEYVFNNVNVCTGEWVHLTIVKNKSMNQVQCYVDGQLKQSLSIFPEDSGKNIVDVAAVAGGDMRNKNEQYFKGRIRDIKVYADARTNTEIASDATKLDKDNLLAYYDFSSAEADASDVADTSGNGYDLRLRTRWVKARPTIEPYDYSFAVVGDTQYVNHYSPENFSKIYDYICDNAEANKLKFVFSMGDITDASSVEEWERAKTQIHRLDSVVPYSILRGNHDFTENINTYFPYSDYEDQLGGSYNGGIENTWRTLTVGEIDYLIMVLDYGPSDEVLSWASDVIKDHPTHNVIITTHAYLHQDGSILDGGFKDELSVAGTGGANNPNVMWENLVSKHSNIVLVMCGHVHSENVVISRKQGDKGNTVTQMLVDGQTLDKTTEGGVGLVAMLYFSEGGSKVQVEYYSTIRGEWFLSDNQFTFDLAVVGKDTELSGDNAGGQSDLDKEPGIANNSVIYIVVGAVVLVAVAAVVGIIIYKKKKQERSE